MNDTQQFLDLLFSDGGKHEIRVLDYGSDERTLSGIYDVPDVEGDLTKLTPDYRGVYVSLNPVHLDPIALRKVRKGEAVKDTQITRRTHLLLDVDSPRADGFKGDMATKEEREEARRACAVLSNDLAILGWPDPITVDSGNGFQLVYRIDLPVDDGGLVKRVLRGLRAKYPGVDVKNSNAARITRLPGTWNRKGRELPDRPYRTTQLVSAPGKMKIVTREQLEAVAEKVESPSAPAAPAKLADDAAWPDMAERAQRAAAYIAKLEPAISGGGGHNATIRAARAIRVDFAVDEEHGWPILVRYNSRCQPPWDAGELRHKWDDAEVGDKPRGCMYAGEHDCSHLPATDPRRLAAEHPDPWLCLHGDLIYRYDGRRWARFKSDTAARRFIQPWVGRKLDSAYEFALAAWENSTEKVAKDKPKRQRATVAFVSEVLDAVCARSLNLSELEMPCLLPHGERVRLLTVENGLLNVDSGELLPHSADWFSTACLPYRYDPAARPDGVVDRCLRVWFGDDSELRAVFQEWCGYCLAHDTGEQAFLAMIGDGGNGKSAALAMLSALLGGRENVSYVGWEAFAERFKLAGMLGKLVNISGDVGELTKADEGRLKEYVGGTPMTFEHKGKTPFEAIPTARLILACNRVPYINDKTDGTWRRMLVLPFDFRIAATNRVKGMDKAHWWTKNADLPALLNWALAGLQRLREQGGFTVTRRGEEAKERLRREFNPVHGWLLENYRDAPDDRQPASLMFERYREWCWENGLKPLSSISFGREVGATFPAATNKPGRVDGKIVRCWFGIGTPPTNVTDTKPTSKRSVTPQLQAPQEVA